MTHDPESTRRRATAVDHLGDPSGPSRGAIRSILDRLPRPESIVLIVSLIGTILAKHVTVRRNAPDDVAAGIVHAASWDVAFFAAVAALFALLFVVRPGRFAARATLITAAVIAVWSFVNAAWLYDTGAQFSPEVLVTALTHDRTTTWAVIVHTIAQNPPKFLPAILFAFVTGAWILYRIVRPLDLRERSTQWPTERWIAIWAACCAAGLGVGAATSSRVTSIWSTAIGFNSHWYAIIRPIAAAGDDDDRDVDARYVPPAGTRAVTPPAVPREGMPNVVVLLLESVSYPATSLGDPALDNTPTLRRLADEGIEFVSTHVNVPYTTKALWATFTGTKPDLRDDAPEAVLVDAPYESLATILKAQGYRSAFFETARGAFEGAPALCANLGFDWAWFRENLEDPSAYIGWIGADDMRMVGPMFEWVDAGPGPFLLAAITSITHDPYELPPWYDEPPRPGKHGRYLQTIECADAFVSEVLRELEARGLADDTLVCVLGDHGEVFRPDSKRGRLAPFEEALRIPWVIWWPKGVVAGQRTEWPCAQIDVTPTILSMLGFDVDRAGFEGRVATVPGPLDRRLYFNCWYHNGPHGYRERDVKYVYHPYTDVLFRYDLATDPHEHAPEEIDDEAVRRSVMEAVQAWENDSHIEFPPRRYRERLLYDHWRVLCTGRRPTAYYVADPDAP
jgi:arylsulfatase A-like enzyme